MAEKLTEIDYIRKLEAVFCEINVLNEDVKQLKSDAKEAGYKATKLAKIAKLKAEAKIGEFVEEMNDLLNFVEEKGL